MWMLMAAFFLIIPTMSHAVDLCEPGYYLDTTTNECTQCGLGKYYCPGDNIRYDCPAPDNHMMSDWPDNYYNPIIDSAKIYFDYTDWQKTLKSIISCRLHYIMHNDYGELYDIRSYNPNTELYDKTTDSYGWTSPYPGYYLTNPKACWSGAYYYDVAKCPSGTYCPGEPAHRGCTNYTQPDDFGLYVCGDNSYSDDGATECTRCPDGTGNSGTNISDHAGISSCLPLCASGPQKLHTGNYIFNIWPKDKCTSPALHIRKQADTCCINITPGNGPGINIQIGNSIYHTIN